MIESCIEARQRSTGQVKLDLIERARARSRTEIDLAARKGAPARDPCRKIQQLAQSLEIRKRVVACCNLRNGPQRRDPGLPKIYRQRDEIEGGIYLERQRLISPIQQVGIGADAAIRVFRRLVKAPADLNVRIGHAQNLILVQTRWGPRIQLGRSSELQK